MFARRQDSSEPQTTSTAIVSIARLPRAPVFKTIAAIFVVTLAITLTFCFSRAAVSAATKTSPNQAPTLAVYPKIPETMERDLTNAFDPQLAWQPTTIGDPFTDRAGYGGALVAASQVAFPSAAAASGGVHPLPGSLSSVAAGSGSPQPPTDETRRAAAQAATKARLEARSRALRDGQSVSPISSVFSYTYVLPVGIVGSHGKLDALFYALPIRKTFSASVGARLFDAEIEAITDDGVTFRDSGGRTHAVGWSKIGGGASTKDSPRTLNEQPSSASPQPFSPERPAPQPQQRPLNGLQQAVRDRYPRLSLLQRPRLSSPNPARSMASAFLLLAL